MNTGNNPAAADTVVPAASDITDNEVLPERLDLGTGEPDVPADAPQDAPADDTAPTDTNTPELTYNGVAVDVEIPTDLREKFTEGGLDIDAVVADLYGGDEFTLSPENHAKLSEMYGASLVDSYLAAITAQNKSMVDAQTSQETAAQQANETAWNETMEQVGGDAAWTELAAWADKTLSDEQFADFNGVMETGSRYAQKLAVADMMRQQNGAEGDAHIELISGDNSPAAGSGLPLSKQDYLELIVSGEYKKDPDKYDALRRAGQTQGI